MFPLLKVEVARQVGRIVIGHLAILKSRETRHRTYPLLLRNDYSVRTLAPCVIRASCGSSIIVVASIPKKLPGVDVLFAVLNEAHALSNVRNLCAVERYRRKSICLSCR